MIFQSFQNMFQFSSKNVSLQSYAIRLFLIKMKIPIKNCAKSGTKIKNLSLDIDILKRLGIK